MPLFDFKCPKCGEKFERIVSSTEGPPPCPAVIGETVCGTTTEKLFITKTSFVLKGGGWYKDGY